MKASKSASKLIEVVQDRNLGIPSSDILRDAASWDQTALGDYVWENLGQETLLTKEELVLYEKLQKSGELDTLLADQALREARALTDHDLQSAISALQTSTAQIEKQSEVLKIQQDALASLVTLNARQTQSRSDTNGAQARAWQAENDALRNEVEELVAGMLDFVREIEVQGSMNEGALSQHAGEVLGGDDKILASLQKLSGALTASESGEGEGNSERIKKLCASLIKYTVEGVRCRLDRVYLEGLEGCLGSEDGGQAERSAELDALKGELESLYSEILPVAQMSAEQRYLQVALRSLAAQGSVGQERSKKVVEYISNCLTFLTNRLDSFSGHTSAYREHTSTLTTLTTLLKSQIASLTQSSHSASAPKPTATAPTAPPSPIRRRASKSSFAPRQTRAPLHRRTSSLSFDESTPPESQLLAALGITLPTPSLSSGDSALTLDALNAYLATSVQDRLHKLDLQQHALQASTEAAVKEHMSDAFLTLQLLRDGVLSESRGRRVVLVDEEVQAAIAGLEQEVQELREDVVGVDLESLRERNQTREGFVERWSH